MNKQAKKRRQKRIRARVIGTAVRPRASIYRSLRHISVQLIDDETGKTLLAVSSVGMPDQRGHSKTEMSQLVGQKAAAQAKKIGVESIVFDRGGFKYHGRVKAVAEALRAGGLNF